MAKIIQVIELEGWGSYVPDSIRVLLDDGTIWHGKPRESTGGPYSLVWEQVQIPNLPGEAIDE